jgi:hypothetical protein
MNILWSGALIVPVVALCASQGPRQRDARGIAAWVALAALLHRYSGASETALDQDLRACRANDPLGQLLSNLRQGRSLLAEPSDFAGALADRAGLLALYVACMHRGILDFYTGSKVLLQPNIDRHHIMPRAQFADGQRAASDCIANIAFISGDVNKAISHSGPEVYLRKLKPNVLKSQCIPNDPKLWDVDSSEEFWDHRRALLAEAFNDFVRESLPQRRL